MIYIGQYKGKPIHHEEPFVAKTCNQTCNKLQDVATESELIKHGRWIRTGEDGYCSVCKCDMPMFRNEWEWEYTETPYCPNCGSRMDLDGDTE